jgi:hypothetical protein
MPNACLQFFVDHLRQRCAAIGIDDPGANGDPVDALPNNVQGRDRNEQDK